MRKLSLAVIGMYLSMVQAFSQAPATDSSFYKVKKLKLDEINLVSSYYDQTADKSAVMGGEPGPRGVANVTDFANSIDLTMIGWDQKKRKNTLAVGLDLDFHTAASQAYVDSNGTFKNDGTRINPTISWTRENEQKGSSFGLGAYYSAEHDYYHSIGVNASASKKNKTNGEFNLKVAGFFDKINMIYPSEFYPVDSVKNAPSTDSIVYRTSASGLTQAFVFKNGQLVGNPKINKRQTPTKPRNSYTASLSYTQIINQRMQGSIEMDLVFQTGYLGLPFHRVFYNTGKDTIENLPSQRFKVPIGFRLNYFLGDRVIIRSYYRFYADSWGLMSNTFNLEVPVKITPFLSVSPFYRFYAQTAARYFAPYKVHSESDTYFTSNYALADFNSSLFGAGIRMAPPKGVLINSLRALEIRYAHYTQTTDLNANIISFNLTFK